MGFDESRHRNLGAMLYANLASNFVLAVPIDIQLASHCLDGNCPFDASYTEERTRFFRYE